MFYASRDRRGEHPERHLTNWSGVLQADAFSGYARLYPPDRKPGPIIEALCWSHARRKFFELADIAANAGRGQNAAPISPIALEAVKRIDAIFEIEREINGVTAEERLAARRSRSAPLVAALEEWTRSERAKLYPHNAIGQAIDYMLTGWPAFSRFLEDGRICLTNNAAERALRGLALGRKSWLFAGSERGAERAAIMYTLNSDRKAQRHRSAGLAHQHSFQDRRDAADPGSANSYPGTGCPTAARAPQLNRGPPRRVTHYRAGATRERSRSPGHPKSTTPGPPSFPPSSASDRS